MHYTHRKRPYHAKAVQLTEATLWEVIDIIETSTKGSSASMYGDTTLMVRFSDNTPRRYNPDVMRIGDWAVTGENGETKIYTDADFKVKYEVIPD